MFGSSSGLEMLMKHFGFDPEAIKAQATDAMNKLQGTIAHFDARLVNLERAQQQTAEALVNVTTAVQMLHQILTPISAYVVQRAAAPHTEPAGPGGAAVPLIEAGAVNGHA